MAYTAGTLQPNLPTGLPPIAIAAVQRYTSRPIEGSDFTEYPEGLYHPNGVMLIKCRSGVPGLGRGILLGSGFAKFEEGKTLDDYCTEHGITRKRALKIQDRSYFTIHATSGPDRCACIPDSSDCVILEPSVEKEEQKKEVEKSAEKEVPGIMEAPSEAKPAETSATTEDSISTSKAKPVPPYSKAMIPNTFYYRRASGNLVNALGHEISDRTHEVVRVKDLVLPKPSTMWDMQEASDWRSIPGMSEYVQYMDWAAVEKKN